VSLTDRCDYRDEGDHGSHIHLKFNRLSLSQGVSERWAVRSFVEKAQFCWRFHEAILPASLAADDNGIAMLRGNGGVLLNRSAAPASAALFPGDTVETQPKAAARIELTGSAVDLNAETIVEFESGEIVLDHGSLSVNTSRSLRVRVGCLSVTPVNPAWTQFEVTDLDGRVTVSALKSDVNIDLPIVQSSACGAICNLRTSVGARRRTEVARGKVRRRRREVGR
jgi:ferric-dicitrate binding protein FerR (iron transport regulator)